MLDWILRVCMLLFLFSFPYFLFSYFRNRKGKYSLYKLFLSVLSVCLSYYMFALATEMGIFYFPSPYRNYKFGFIDVASYLPFLLLLLIIPLLLLNRKIVKDNLWKMFSGFLFTVNNAAYLILIVLF